MDTTDPNTTSPRGIDARGAASPADDRLLARWCESSDVDALTQLFDRTAPKLLRIALHVVTDPAEAEDLVQATFVAVIEKRRSIDPSRASVGWMVNVLRNKAASRLRHTGRAAHPQSAEMDVLHAQDDAVDAPMERRELSAALNEAVDALDEPYRQVMLLRLRHGANAVEIGHLLQRSPGSVRVQIHRGVEQLRRALGTSLAGAALAAVLTELGEAAPAAHVALRGLDAVRTATLQHATTTAAATGAAAGAKVLIGSSLMLKKSLILVAAVILFSSLAWFATSRGNAPDLTTGDVQQQATLAPKSSGDGEALATVSQDVERAATPEVLSQPDRVAATGTVIDVETEQPIEGALIEVFPPQRLTVGDALRQHPEAFYQNRHGALQSRNHQDWPAIDGVGNADQYGAVRHDMFGFARDAAAVANASTNHEGAFHLDVPRERSGEATSRWLMRVTKDGYAPRTTVLDRTSTEPIALFRSKIFGGVAIDQEGRPVSLDLAIASGKYRPQQVDESLSPADLRRAQLAQMKSINNTVGLTAERVTTDSDGAFEVSVGAESIHVASLDPRWRVKFASSNPGADQKVWLEATSCIRVIDDATEEPVERIHIVARERRNGYVRWSGRHYAPRGFLDIGAGGIGLDWMEKSGTDLAVWAEGYAPTHTQLSVEDLEETVQIRLVRGAADRVHGIVHRAGEPAGGVRVELIATSRLQWRRDEEHTMDAISTGADGRFQLTGIPGPAAVRIQTKESAYLHMVDLPRRAPLDIDLDALGSIRVTITTPEGVPQAGHVAALQNSRGLSVRGNADENGVIAFEALGPGEYLAMAPYVSREGSFTGDLTETVTVVQGKPGSCTFVVPDPTKPRYLRIAAPTPEDTAGWKVRGDKGDAVVVEADGTVPIDLSKPGWQLRIKAPDGRRWELRIPPGAPSGYLVQLVHGEATVRGHLLGKSGKPLAGVAVRIHHGKHLEDQIEASVVTDEDGSFELRGVAEGRRTMSLRSKPDSLWPASNHPVDGTRAMLDVTASGDHYVRIQIPDVKDTILVQGRVLGPDGEPFAEGKVSIRGLQRQGDAEVAGADGWVIQDIGEDGSFEWRRPRMDVFTLGVWPPDRGKRITEQRIEVPVSGPMAPIVIRL